MSFSSFGLNPALLRGVQDMGFAAPTPIQEQAVPAAIGGRDLIACAMTGSGKTAAFLLPIVQRLIDRPRGVTRALILTPTRELAAQIEEHLRALAVHTPVRGASVFGGVGMGPQEAAFRRGVDVIVATPGRLLDHMKAPYVRFDQLEVLVLDEADRMLDMGFLPDIKRVLARLPAKKQTLFFSATMPDAIARLAKDLLHDPVAINQERKAAPATGVDQALYPVAESSKAQLFLELIRKGEVKDVIVFTRTKHRSNRLYDFLTKHGVSCERIHGNRSQAQRTQALDGFKSGKVQVLVATDIVARGIDIEELSHVVNFDVPHVPEDYIHRVGRTARAEATGDAITFVSPEEETDLRAIERAINKRIPRRTLAGFDYNARPAERFEVPIAERIAEIRKRKAEERARAKEKLERKSQREAGESRRVASGDRTPARPSNGSAGGARPAGPSRSANPYADRAGGNAAVATRQRRGGGRGGSGGRSA